MQVRRQFAAARRRACVRGDLCLSGDKWRNCKTCSDCGEGEDEEMGAAIHTAKFCRSCLSISLRRLVNSAFTFAPRSFAFSSTRSARALANGAGKAQLPSLCCLA
ncbi:hypothetical protein VM77_05185 [Citromicrobium sp. JL31]|nr:hypothetical protein VM77_05185 [Citromicrobium sp. JL31]